MGTMIERLWPIGCGNLAKQRLVKNYFLLCRIEDPIRRWQLEWYLERVQLLAKTNTMSKDSYYMIRVAEKGIKVSWSKLVYIKLNFEAIRHDVWRKLKREKHCYSNRY